MRLFTNMRQWLTLSALALVGTTASVSHATMTIPGTVCQPSQDQVGHDITWLTYNVYGASNQFGSTSNFATVDCPILNPGPDPFEIDAHVYDRHPNAQIACTAYRSNWNGDPVFTSTKHGTANTGPEQVLVFSVGSTTSTYLYDVRCTIPANAGGLGASYITSFVSWF